MNTLLFRAGSKEPLLITSYFSNGVAISLLLNIYAVDRLSSTTDPLFISSLSTAAMVTLSNNWLAPAKSESVEYSYWWHRAAQVELPPAAIATAIQFPKTMRVSTIIIAMPGNLLEALPCSFSNPVLFAFISIGSMCSLLIFKKMKVIMWRPIYEHDTHENIIGSISASLIPPIQEHHIHTNLFFT